MERLTKRMSDGSYQANNETEYGGENSYDYKNAIIEKCGRLEDLLDYINNYLKKDERILKDKSLEAPILYPSFIFDRGILKKFKLDD